MSNTVTEEQITALIARSKTTTDRISAKTTLVVLTLPCGFEITETSSCVDPTNYDHELGVQCALSKIKTKLWELEGYALQRELYEGVTS